MKLPIYIYGHPVLRAVSAPLEPGYPDLAQLIADMYETMAYAEGVGLAAPQVGRSVRLVVIDATPLAEDFPECEGWRRTLINPTVEVLDGDPVSRAEGCLSLPGLSEDVKRVEHIRLSYVDENFQPRTEELTGYVARVVQHECDHLEGKVYMDHVSGIRRALDRSKLNALVNGTARPAYPVRFAPKKKK